MISEGFHYTTTEISRQKVSLIHQVIPYFVSIMMALEVNIDKIELPHIIQHASLCGCFMLNKYYALTDEFSIHRDVSPHVLEFLY